jgi:hypothetical protein
MSIKELTPRQARWCEYLSSFNFEIKYKPGKKNLRADALTRREEDLTPTQILAKEQRTQPFLKNYQLDPRNVQELATEAS